MNQTELIHAMALTLFEGVGNINAKKLLAYCGSFEAVFNSHKGKLTQIPGIGEVLSTSIVKQIKSGEAIK